MRKTIASTLAVLAALLVGCANPDSDDETELVRPPVEFKGSPDDRFAAKWVTESGDSKYVFKKDGTYELDSKVRVQGRAPIDSHSTGEWRVDGDRMLFRDSQGNVAPYTFQLNGDTLELTLTGKLKSKTVLKRS